MLSGVLNTFVNKERYVASSYYGFIITLKLYYVNSSGSVFADGGI